MALTLDIPTEYGYVVLTATATAFLGLWHSAYVGIYRKAAQVPYPNAYATQAEAKENPAKHAFNCAQRAHANFLEHRTQMLIPMLMAGLRYPVLSAGLGAAWCVARVMYAVGYVKGKREQGRGRSAGTWYLLAEVILQGTAAWTGWQMLAR